MIFELTILGSSSATPAFQRNPASQVLNINERLFLIDCGEATQIQLTRFKVKLHRINHIFISHLHGDHYLGLMGLLATFHLQGRTNELHLYCPKELKEILELQFQVSDTRLRFEIMYHFVVPGQEKSLLHDEEIEVLSIPLNHRVPCSGFLFRERPRRRNLIIEKVQALHIPVDEYQGLKEGNDYKDKSGKVYPNESLTTGPKPPRSFAYCSDTMYDEGILDYIRGIDLLYHESTFMHDLLPRALETFHTTSLQAAQMAKLAGVKKLLIGHFSARYKDLKPMLEEARSVFPETSLALEGERFSVE